MWNRDSSSTGQTLPAQPTPAPATTPTVSSQSVSRGTSVVGETMRIEGTFTSQEEVLIAGELKGRIDVDGRLTQGPKSKIEANIKAREATIGGVVKGNVESLGRLVLRAGANLIGDVKTTGIVIEDGAYFKGGIDITRSAS